MATVILPWRGGCPYRERARKFLEQRYATHFPQGRTLWAEWNGDPWSKASAVTPALKSASSDAVIVADADVWTDGLESAVRAVTAGVAEWAAPHKIVYRLDEAETTQVIGGFTWAPSDLSKLTCTRRPYLGVLGGGIVVAHRDTLLEVPLDPRFSGLDAGHEDEAWAMALQTLKGPAWQGGADLIHLWHPPRPRLSHRRGSLESWNHYKRYAGANFNPEAMRSLIEEIDEPSQPDVPSLHDRPSISVG